MKWVFSRSWHSASTWQKSPLSRLEGNNRLRAFLTKETALLNRLPADYLTLFQSKTSHLPLFVFISVRKCAQRKIQMCVFLLQRVSENPLFIKMRLSSFGLRLYVLLFVPETRWGGYLRSARPLGSKPFSSLTVFDPETGWQLSLTAAWLNAQRSSHRAAQGRKSDISLFYWHKCGFVKLLLRRTFSITHRLCVVEVTKHTWARGLLFSGGNRRENNNKTHVHGALRTSWFYQRKSHLG